MDFTVELIVDDVSQGVHAGSVGVAFATATAFIGHGASLHTTNKLVYADDVDVIRGGAGLLSNTGFESAPNAYGLGVSGANWGRYTQNVVDSTAERITSPLPVHSGMFAGRVVITAGAGDRGAYFFQDLALLPGESFDLDGWLWIDPASAEVQFRIIFDWDRGGGFLSGEATVVGEPGVDTEFSAWGVGGTAPPLPTGQWTHVILRIDTATYEGWVTGYGFGPNVPPGFLG